jgi:hypothetical protein
MRDAQRGQAIAETVVFLPMFLLSLFGIIWAVQAAVQYERIESAVRYAGLVSQHADPYSDYSLYSMYTQLGSTLMPTVTCVTPLTTPLSDAAPTYSSIYLTPTSNPFWQPYAATPRCSSSGIIGIEHGSALTQDVILSEQEPGMTSKINAPSYLTSALGTTTSMTAQTYFFRPVGVNVILACYSALNTQIQHSLQYATDTSAATTPAALGSTVTALTPTISSNCTSF